MSQLEAASKNHLGSVLPLEKYCLIILGGKRQGQVLPLAGCPAYLIEVQGP